MGNEITRQAAVRALQTAMESDQRDPFGFYFIENALNSSEDHLRSHLGPFKDFRILRFSMYNTQKSSTKSW